MLDALPYCNPLRSGIARNRRHMIFHALGNFQQLLFRIASFKWIYFSLISFVSRRLHGIADDHSNENRLRVGSQVLFKFLCMNTDCIESGCILSPWRLLLCIIHCLRESFCHNPLIVDATSDKCMNWIKRTPWINRFVSESKWKFLNAEGKFS